MRKYSRFLYISSLFFAFIFSLTDIFSYTTSLDDSFRKGKLPEELYWCIFGLFFLTNLLSVTPAYGEKTYNALQQTSNCCLPETTLEEETNEQNGACTKIIRAAGLITPFLKGPITTSSFFIHLAGLIRTWGAGHLESSSYLIASPVWLLFLPPSIIAQLGQLYSANSDTQVTRLTKRITKYIPDRWLARLANAPTLVFYYKTALELVLNAGWTSEESGPLVWVLRFCTLCLFLSGNLTYERGINKITGNETNSLENQLLENRWVKTGVDLPATFIRSVTGVLGITSAWTSIAKQRNLDENTTEALKIFFQGLSWPSVGIVRYGYFAGQRSTPAVTAASTNRSEYEALP